MSNIVVRDVPLEEMDGLIEGMYDLGFFAEVVEDGEIL